MTTILLGAAQIARLEQTWVVYKALVLGMYMQALLCEDSMANLINKRMSNENLLGTLRGLLSLCNCSLNKFS